MGLGLNASEIRNQRDNCFDWSFHKSYNEKKYRITQAANLFEPVFVPPFPSSRQSGFHSFPSNMQMNLLRLKSDMKFTVMNYLSRESFMSVQVDFFYSTTK